jgi:hypothetical protein
MKREKKTADWLMLTPLRLLDLTSEPLMVLETLEKLPIQEWSPA